MCKLKTNILDASFVYSGQMKINEIFNRNIFSWVHTIDLIETLHLM